MKPARPLFIIAGLLLLSACQSMTPEQRRAADEAQCVGYGFKPATDAFAECLQRLDLDRRADARADSIRASQMMWDRPMIVERRVIVSQ